LRAAAPESGKSRIEGKRLTLSDARRGEIRLAATQIRPETPRDSPRPVWPRPFSEIVMFGELLGLLFFVLTFERDQRI
jgi:hypothetical protein